MDTILTMLQEANLVPFMYAWQWSWPIAETLHFSGMTILIGAIMITDLRLMGAFKHINIHSTHTLIWIAVIGFGINLITGLGFFLADPFHYSYATSFQWKVLFLVLAGINAAYFTFALQPKWNEWDPYGNPPMAARISGALSLTFWMLVLIFGRLIEYL